ncbi:alkaline shock response membrane anchor protein AmaP [Paenibacillus sp. SC116]|uniref:alkaline shock response membrane anchor protein AmaP n=1 Tax=Paenibacillus sp. SC116 TaxID=2968986 RepID=UPI00215A8B1E|nr:alkaline shock response membrane anchor protein AmaP [Paenibacillus sp. SC116]MCR8843163.1 alkaline shock response membrane anchor protein AmaP [Paenibacillus sp. SC116]
MGRIVDRLLLFVYSLTIGTLSAAAIVGASGLLTDTSEFYLDLSQPAWLQMAIISVAAVVFLISLRMFILSIKRDSSAMTSIDQRTEFGDIKISLETIENVSLKAAARVRGTKDLKARIRAIDSGLDITIRAVVDGETSIPEMTAEVQRNVKEYVQDITGIPVSLVSVYVANIVQTQTFKARVE